jgi:thiol:disulfide interchange protein
MKKNILFLMIMLLSGLLFADWQSEVANFEEVARDVGYKPPAEMVEFLDGSTAGGTINESKLWNRFSKDPVAFLEESGMGLTIVLILLGGLALNLTPCVLPMIPVNIAIIGAGAQSESRSKGFALGGTYGLGIASVYGVLGLVAVLGGKGFGQLNANPWFNFSIAGIFVLLALSMFDVLHIDLSKFQSGKGTQFKSKFASAFFMGGIAALLAGACVAPVVIAVLLLAGKLGTVGLFLPFLLGVGMALPWPFAGAGFAFLPKPGKWMDWVKYGFGVLILLLALYYGKLGADLMKPQASVDDEKGGDLGAALAVAYQDQRPAIVYFSAEWCKNCKELEAKTWPDPAVQERLSAYEFIKIDATDYEDPSVAEMLQHFGVQGLPTFVIMRPAYE